MQGVGREGKSCNADRCWGSLSGRYRPEAVLKSLAPLRLIRLNSRQDGVEVDAADGVENGDAHRHGRGAWPRAARVWEGAPDGAVPDLPKPPAGPYGAASLVPPLLIPVSPGPTEQA